MTREEQMQLISQLLDGELDGKARDKALDLVQADEDARAFLRDIEADRERFASLQTAPIPVNPAAELSRIRSRIAAEERLIPISALADKEVSSDTLEATSNFAEADSEAAEFLAFIESSRDAIQQRATPEPPAIQDALADIHALLKEGSLLEQASQLADDELDPPTASSVRIAVEADPEASAFMDFVEESREDIRAHAAPTPAATVEPALRDIQAAIRDNHKPGILLRFPVLWGIAAAAALFIGFGLSSAFRGQSNPAATTMLTAMMVEEVETDIPNAIISMYNAPEAGCPVIWITEMPDEEPEA